ncbi:MAG: ABC transporter ATP-binding protein [Actinomycetia bacterium]|nr:ABC transporter ATP-binding protein [Actinomycetes bacterium]
MAGLEIVGAGLVYRGVDGRETVALAGVDLTVDDGESVCLIGPSGCGKSSLLELIAGLRSPTSGTVSIDGRPVAGPRRGTGYIPQGGGLLPWRDALGNAALGLVVQHVGRDAREAAARAALATVGLGDRVRSYPAELSGGMRQRLALARCLAADADVILADEPFSALDALTREQMQQVVLDLWRRLGYTQLMVTHSVEEACWLGQRIVVMTAGPGRVSAIVDNPGAGSDGWRSSPAFAARCAHVRTLLDEATRPSDRGVDA